MLVNTVRFPALFTAGLYEPCLPFLWCLHMGHQSSYCPEFLNNSSVVLAQNLGPAQQGGSVSLGCFTASMRAMQMGVKGLLPSVRHPEKPNTELTSKGARKEVRFILQSGPRVSLKGSSASDPPGCAWLGRCGAGCAFGTAGLGVGRRMTRGRLGCWAQCVPCLVCTALGHTAQRAGGPWAA